MDLFGGRPAQETFENQKQQNYFKLWEIEERRTRGALSSFLENAGLGELSLVHEVMNALPSRGNLHLANSLSVRYANYVGLSPDRTDVKVYANRGTSGIDGCTSTAVGHALSGPEMNVLITGDVAFFYDRNAFWHNYELPNLRIVLLNNHGGAIFKMVDGAEDLPESDAYFVTEQKLNAKKLCEEFGFEHIRLDNKRKMVNALKNFFDNDKAVKVLELENTATAAKSVLDDLKQHLKKRYEL
jgi:2-succinyl-5-enolpyruvyl-6-hydroxy-3-cyclohexene-1-carboxylate synthase